MSKQQFKETRLTIFPNWFTCNCSTTSQISFLDFSMSIERNTSVLGAWGAIFGSHYLAGRLDQIDKLINCNKIDFKVSVVVV